MPCKSSKEVAPHDGAVDAHLVRAASASLNAWQDPRGVSCAAKFNHDETANFVKRDGAWTHMAVTWTAANDGLTTIYQDGEQP